MEKEKVEFKTKMKNFFGKIKGRFKAFFNKEYLSYSFHKYKAFTALQIREVFSSEKTTKNQTRDKVIAIVSPIIKFIVVFAITFVLFFLNSIFGIIFNNTSFEGHRILFGICNIDSMFTFFYSFRCKKIT